MGGGAVSGNTASFNGGGVYVSDGTFSMSGGAVVRDNILSGTTSYGREVLVYSGTFKLSEGAMPQRVFLRKNTLYNNPSVTIRRPLSGEIIPIDLGITSSVPLTSYVNKPILERDVSYPGPASDMASLKTHFVLGNAKWTDYSSDSETPITGYKINDEGRFVQE
jgi:hypothetical protein